MKSSDDIGENRSQHARQFRCPTCKRVVKSPEPDSPARMKFFPFCSERCKLIDLGAWFDAEYKIASQSDEESEGPAGDESSA